MDEMINNLLSAWKLICILKTYKTCNSIVKFPKYKFNNKLIGDITLFRVTNKCKCVHEGCISVEYCTNGRSQLK